MDSVGDTRDYGQEIRQEQFNVTNVPRHTRSVTLYAVALTQIVAVDAFFKFALFTKVPEEVQSLESGRS